MRLDDSVIGHVAKLVQIAILTGTDVVDHMRMVRLSDADGVLFLDPERPDDDELIVIVILHHPFDNNNVYSR